MQKNLRGASEAFEQTEDRADRILDPTVGIHHQPFVARPNVTDGNADSKLPASRFRDGRIDQPLADQGELELAHCPLQSQEEAVVRKRGMLDPIAIDPLRADGPAQLSRVTPVASVPR